MNKLSPRQLSMFWKFFARACSCQKVITPDAKDLYRHTLMREECGLESIKDANNTTDFDSLMYRLAVDGYDSKSAFYYASALERRYTHMIDVCLRQIAQIEGITNTNDKIQYDAIQYLSGIIKQAGYQIHCEGADYWLDLSTQQLKSLFLMLDTHRRRLLKKSPTRINTYAFRADYSYLLIHGVGVIILKIKPEPTPIKIKTIKEVAHA